MQRAVEELNAEPRAATEPFAYWSYPRYVHDPIVLTVARLIAKHEQPPVDPILAAAREAVARWQYVDSPNSVGVCVAAITLYLEREASK